MRELKLKNKIAAIPIIQGGMGVGVSRCQLAGAVAKEGGVGIISTAQIGYDEEGFAENENSCNLHAIDAHIKKAKEIAGGNGLVGVNVMVALKHYREHVAQAVQSGADVIICGAGIPADLPEIIQEAAHEYNIDACRIPAIAPIVSSEKATRVILKMWDKKYKTVPDFIVMEGPKAGGHLGYSKEQLQNIDAISFEEEIKKIIVCKQDYEKKYMQSIPVIVAGGIFDKKDIDWALNLGADGVQIASRFVATYECDACDAYKQAYIHAKKEDVQIVQSPVGLPGRALHNSFISQVEAAPKKITKCYQCLKHCNPAQVPYCITKALIDAVKGNVEEGLIFCGSNVDRIDHLLSVHELMTELTTD